MGVESLRIKNFRGIGECCFSDFTQVNVFIGKNGLGKSSVLEAIYLASSKFHRDYFLTSPFIRIIEKRGWGRDQLSAIVSEIKYKHIFDPSITLNDERYMLSLSSLTPALYEQLDEKTRKEIEPDRSVVFRVEKEEKKESKWYCDVILSLHRFSTKLVDYVIFSDDFKKDFEEEFKRSILIDEQMIRDVSDIALIFGLFVDIGGWKAKKAIVEALSKFYEGVCDIDMRGEMVRVIFEDYAVSFSSIADGLKSAIIISLAARVMERGVLCVEEPENHLHPALQEFYIRQLIESSAERGNQVFISTHSLEFIERLLKEARERNVPVNVYNFTAIENGRLKYRVYKRDVAYLSIREIGRDLRI